VAQDVVVATLMLEDVAAQATPVWREREIVRRILTVMEILFVGIITARHSDLSSTPRTTAV